MGASCTHMAGDLMCSVKLAGDDIVAKLKSSLCEKLQWTSMVLWNGPENVPEANQLSEYSLLTAERSITLEHVCGCYQHHDTGYNAAGYGSSGTSSSHWLVLEPGRAGLQHYFKGDYKRAEELRKLMMTDARWSIDMADEGNYVVRIVGKARLDRYFVHERSGNCCDPLTGYECYAQVTIPLHQLEQGQ